MGNEVGAAVGEEGATDGCNVGSLDGVLVGTEEGAADGTVDGLLDGALVGTDEGEGDGDVDGLLDGDLVGTEEGAQGSKFRSTNADGSCDQQIS